MAKVLWMGCREGRALQQDAIRCVSAIYQARWGQGRCFSLAEQPASSGRHEVLPQNRLFRLRVRTVKDSHRNSSEGRSRGKIKPCFFVLPIKCKSQLLERNIQELAQDIKPNMNIYIYICLINQLNICKDFTLLAQNINTWGNQLSKATLRVPPAPPIHHLESP